MNTVSADDLEAALNGYKAAVQFTFGNRISRGFAPASLAVMRRDVANFLLKNVRDVSGRYVEAGTDFWLTRKREGAGFWDGDWPEPAASRLTASAHAFGEQDVYVGDDGMLHVSGEHAMLAAVQEEPDSGLKNGLVLAGAGIAAVALVGAMVWMTKGVGSFTGAETDAMAAKKVVVVWHGEKPPWIQDSSAYVRGDALAESVLGSLRFKLLRAQGFLFYYDPDAQSSDGREELRRHGVR
jgi:hypothetical protein